MEDKPENKPAVNPGGNGKGRSKANKGKVALITVGSILACLIIAAGVMILILYNQYRYLGTNPLSAFQSNSCAAVPEKTIAPDTDIPDPTPEADDPIPVPTPEKTPATGQINIMLIGLDRSADRDTEDMGARNDTNIVLSVDFDKKTAKMLAIPRDTFVMMNKINDKGKTTSKFTSNIFTAFHNGGGESGYGYQNIMQVTSKFLSCGNKYSVPIERYVSIDIDGIVPMCDAMGGVPVTLDADFPGPDKVLGWKKGQTVTLQGDYAQFYLRWRHPEDVGDHTGDIGRGHRQQVFLIALAKKIKDMGPLETVQKLFGSMQKYMRTNLSAEQLVALAEALKGMDMSAINIKGVDGYIGNRNNRIGWVAETKKLEKTVEDIFFN